MANLRDCRAVVKWNLVEKTFLARSSLKTAFNGKLWQVSG